MPAKKAKKSIEPELHASTPMPQVNKSVDEDLRKRVDEVNKKLKDIVSSDTLPVMDDDTKGAQDLSIQLYSTGILTLDRALAGGLPVGRITEFYGEEFTGKSLVSQLAIAAMQKNGGKCLLFDTESSYDPKRAVNLGVQTDKLMVSDSNVLEDMFKIIEAYSEAKIVDLVVIDSIANVTTLDVMNSELGAPKYASVPGVLQRMIPRVSKVLKRNNTQLIIINQLRDTIGSYVPMTHTTGGRQLKHMYHSRVQFLKANASKLLKDGDVVKGVEIEAKITKHRGGANFTQATFRVEYATGLDRIYDVVNFLLSAGFITRAGAFYTYGEATYQGLENLMDSFRSDKVAYDAAVKFAYSILNNEAAAVLPVTDAQVPVDENVPDLSIEEPVKENQ